MEIVMKATYAGYCLEAKGFANNGKGLRANVEAMLDELHAVYEYDNVAGSVLIQALEVDGVDCAGWWDAYIDYNDNRVYLLSNKDYF
ncbi:hypothetical protein [Klebsiella phage phiKp_4]|jgi:hypothetical protein|nr:hypothetical protein [Klebsiella phage phiKp_1]BEH83779.1 hypothetical protein [Klebsiella phage phiKp_3]BEH84174.1 hypothetical protein [Klebsiella phage phiKp_4]BEH84451.1 hypothetical protein [Klebsiella phage phiKp_5]BEH84828.1 hypothetical protein [Klebsiella phage phiKp_8]BEH84913.1 hypothetical protein [Klebsiella phage phiKp_9]BEH85324.1 hypothetical protein [Klebsiella phage phiKp_10]BEH85633.1 hypothetical protein [Klebsiella phage phiKp_11]BEH85750.1 hypothetical protein [Kleb